MLSTPASMSRNMGIAVLACTLAVSSAFLAPAATFGRTQLRASVSARSLHIARAGSASTRSVRAPMHLQMNADLVSQLKSCKADLADLIDKTNANPLMVRLAWHDSGTYDCSIKEWPQCGGAIGSIRFDPEINHGANAGLNTALKLLEPIKKKYPLISHADLFQMASAVAIEQAGGPQIDMKYGRVDAVGPQDCSPEGNLPDAEAGPNGKYGGTGGTKPTEDTTPGGHLRKVFHRMGLSDQDIVALSGAHTLGRAWKDRSGLGAEKTKFTDGKHIARGDGKAGIGKAGGSSWTEKWLKFDNSYFQTIPDEKADAELLKLSTDKILFADDGFRPHAEKYRDDQTAFFKEYAVSHKKLSELGSKFEPAAGVKI